MAFPMSISPAISGDWMLAEPGAAAWKDASPPGERVRLKTLTPGVEAAALAGAADNEVNTIMKVTIDGKILRTNMTILLMSVQKVCFPLPGCLLTTTYLPQNAGDTT
jgi:hypothetical protein